MKNIRILDDGFQWEILTYEEAKKRFGEAEIYAVHDGFESLMDTIEDLEAEYEDWHPDFGIELGFVDYKAKRWCQCCKLRVYYNKHLKAYECTKCKKGYHRHNLQLLNK